jgi:hypothetical protein
VKSFVRIVADAGTEGRQAEAAKKASWQDDEVPF